MQYYILKYLLLSAKILYTVLFKLIKNLIIKILMPHGFSVILLFNWEF
jgi:hypothetical protein